MKRGDLSKQELYESVKTMIEVSEEHPHIHLSQHKLFTLFSIGFQYLLYQSTKNPGSYIIRVEDSALADKLARKSKDESTRRFIQNLLLPRKLKFSGSTFFLDFFHIGSWNLTNEIPKEKLRGALIVKNTSTRPMSESPNDMVELVEDEQWRAEASGIDLPRDYYVNFLKDVVPQTITIAFEQEFDSLHPVEFPFIKKDKERTVSGVTLSSKIDWDQFE